MKRRLNYMWQGVTLMAGSSRSPACKDQRPTSSSALHKAAKCNRVSSHLCTTQVKSVQLYMVTGTRMPARCICTLTLAAMVLVSSGEEQLHGKGTELVCEFVYLCVFVFVYLCICNGVGIRWRRSSCTAKAPELVAGGNNRAPRHQNQNYLNCLQSLYSSLLSQDFYIPPHCSTLNTIIRERGNELQQTSFNGGQLNRQTQKSRTGPHIENCI